MLRLEDAPTLSMDLDKGNGIVFDYEEVKMKKLNWRRQGLRKCFFHMFGLAISRIPKPLELQSDVEGATHYGRSQKIHESSTVKRINFSEAESSGTFVKLLKPRKRPYKSKRKKRGCGTEL